MNAQMRVVGYRIVTNIPDSDDSFQVMDYKPYERHLSLEDCRALAENEAEGLRAANHGASIHVIEIKG